MSTSPIKKARSSASRCLFPKRDSSSTLSWIRGELEKHQAEQIQKWGFNFIDSSPTGSSAFEYELVPAGSVPEFYRNKTLFSTPAKCSYENGTPEAADSSSSESSSESSSDVSMDEEEMKLTIAKPVLPKKRRSGRLPSKSKKVRQIALVGQPRINGVFPVTKRDQTSVKKD